MPFTRKTVTADQVAAFAKRWPCCNFPELPVTFEFDPDGNLVAIEDPGDWTSRSGIDERAVAALAEDAQTGLFDKPVAKPPFTPGPWEVWNYGESVIDVAVGPEAGGVAVCQIVTTDAYGIATEKTEKRGAANALLISQSPAMFEALESIGAAFRQANLLATATEVERSAALERLLNAWNEKACPVMETLTGDPERRSSPAKAKQTTLTLGD